MLKSVKFNSRDVPVQEITLAGEKPEFTIPEPEENEVVVEAMPLEFRRVPLEPVLQDVPCGGSLQGLTRDGHLRTLPGAPFQGDGFFAALLERPVP